MSGKFIGDWGNINDLVRDFGTDAVLDYNVILASYVDEDYHGQSYVLCEKGGDLFETEASHCSCYGLDGTWAPAKVTIDYLKNRVAKLASSYHEDPEMASDYQDKHNIWIAELEKYLEGIN